MYFYDRFNILCIFQTISGEFDELDPEAPIDPSIPVDCYGPPDNVSVKQVFSLGIS